MNDKAVADFAQDSLCGDGAMRNIFAGLARVVQRDFEGLQYATMLKSKGFGVSVSHRRASLPTEFLCGTPEVVTIDGVTAGSDGESDLEVVGLFQNVAALQSITSLGIYDRRFDDARFAQLRKCTSLSFVALSGTKCGDRTCENLVALPHLRQLILSDTLVTNSGVQKLWNGRLVQLDVSRCGIGDSAFDGCCTHEHLLEYVNVGDTNITNVGVHSICQASNLRQIVLLNTSVTDAAVNAMVKAQLLEVIDASGTRISDEGVRQLGALPRLSTLCVDRTEVTGDCHLDGGFPELTVLSMEGNVLSTRGAGWIAGLPSLVRLDLADSCLEVGALGELSRQRTLEHLVLDGTSVKDSDIPALASMVNLQTLSLQRVHVSASGLEKLGSSKSLRELDMSGVDMSKEDKLQVRRALPGVIVTSGDDRGASHVRSEWDELLETLR